MPQADTAAAPAPVTPRTFRKRRRSTELLMSVVAHAAVAGHVVLGVAAHAPPHAQGRNLGYLRHLLDVPVTCHARLCAERLDMPHVRETDEAGEGVDPNPFRRFSLAPSIPHLLDLHLMGGRASADQLMAAHASLQRRNPRLAGDGGRVVTVHTRDLILPGMDVVAKEDRLARPLQAAGIGDDGCCVTRGSGLSLLAVRSEEHTSELQSHHDLVC